MKCTLPTFGASFKPIFDKYLPGLPEGELAEFGVYNGGHTRILAEYGRPVWAFDTFKGIPKEDYIDGLDVDKPGTFEPSVDVETMFDGYPNIKPMVGRFVDTIGLVPSEIKFALVFLDCDLYESYKLVLNWLEDRMIPGGIIDEWISKTGLIYKRDERLIIWDKE